jgi:hypothetical protein
MNVTPSNRICVRCKGTRMLCGKPVCPLVQKAKAMHRLRKTVDSTELYGSSPPAVFIGHVGYPEVFTGPMLAPFSHSESLDIPEQWFGLPLSEVIQRRYALLRTKDMMKVTDAQDPGRLLEDMQDLAMSVGRSVDSEAIFKRRPLLETRWDPVAAPYGASVPLEKFELTENPRIPRKVDRVVSDELKAAEGMTELYDHDIPVSSISKILSVGLLGMDDARKLVPTRWSITATDDTVGKEMIKNIKDYEELSDFLLFRSAYAGNFFNVMLVPGKWSFEVIEVYVPGSIWMHDEKDTGLVFMKDWEPYKGRTTYASNVAGGYYAARVSVLEGLKRMKRQGTAIVFREITPEYWTPVGVWQVRENVRNAMKQKNRPTKFDTLEQMLAFVSEQSYTKGAWERESHLLPVIRSREALLRYMRG